MLSSVSLPVCRHVINERSHPSCFLPILIWFFISFDNVSLKHMPYTEYYLLLQYITTSPSYSGALIVCMYVYLLCFGFRDRGRW